MTCQSERDEGDEGAGEKELLIIDQCPILRLLYETLRERSVQVPDAQCPKLN
ncbi:hypothetical protein LC613_29405 [Nostoc sphaeroides CHAB 2801]|uniref:Uncharacterized protein n=1 Tax=Nostoc sphaeroides CCNUC1 TaxID=2653204 RepID=A0A5P8W617_9NOSO|nr:hypothetical protein [Nostoc sphaeroides]MCC5631822.1 hypothetical protein [Nostoc sphaeroides CHAB 2801]QFS48203.1 hypothetical protein GXM_05695 [Nostoc sphaeroides CCNUC1]